MEFKFNLTKHSALIDFKLHIESPNKNPSELFAAITTLCTNYINEAGQTDHSVQMTSFGGNKINAIKIVREFLHVGLKEAKDLVEATPGILVKGLSEAVANRMVGQLQAIGAVARAIPTKSLCML